MATEIGELLFLEMKELQQGSFSLILTSTASFLLVFGWFMTSPTAQKLIQSSKRIVWIVSSGLITTFFSLVYIQYRLWHTSQELIMQIPETRFFSRFEQYKFRLINGTTVSLMESGQLMLILLFIIAIFHIYKKGQESVVLEKDVD